MSTHTRCVLIIDPDPDALTNYQQALQPVGLIVQTTQAVEALAPYPQPCPYDVVLLTLANCTNLAPLEQLRCTYPDVPIVLIGAHEPADQPCFTSEHLSTVVQSDVQALLWKPLSSSDVDRTIRTILQKQQTARTQQTLATIQRLTSRWQVLFSHPDLHHLYQLTIELVVSELAADNVLLLLWNQDEAILRVAANSAASCCKAPGQQVPLTGTLSGWVVQQHKPLLVNNDQPLPPELQHLADHSSLGSALVAPLLREGRLLGVIAAIRTPGQPQLGWLEHDVLLLLAEQVAAALDHLRHYTVTMASEARHRTLLRHATDAMLLLDAQGQHILDANLAAERLSGYSRVALLHLEPRALLTGHAPLYQEQPLTAEYDTLVLDPSLWVGATEVVDRPTRSAEEGEEIEALLHTKSGYGLPVSLSVSRITCDDEQFLLVVARDVSKRWRMAQQLIQTEKLAAVGRLVSSVAHEINNPLQAIYNSLHLLINRPLDDEKRQRYLVMAHEEVERMITIVRRLLDTYRPSREGMRPTDLHNLLHMVMSVLHQQLHESAVRVVYDLYPGLPLVSGISSQLKQVYMSVILNAIESMPEGGVLTVRSYVTSALATEPLTRNGHIAPYATELKTGEPAPKPDAVVIEFSDTGRGIPPDQITKVFEPFYTTRSDGLGLGLAISYGIVEQHQGRLTVSSILGQGTTFSLYLPVAN